MSITIIQQPQQPQPSANKSIYVVSGSNQASGNFRYVADVEGSTLLARLKCDKLPNGNGFFNIAPVAKTLIVPAKPDPVAGWQDAGVLQPYTIKFREEFGTPPVVSTGSTNASGLIWGAYYPQQNIPVTSGYLFAAANGNPLALTNRPKNITIKSGQNDWIACIKDDLADTFIASIIYPTRAFDVNSPSGSLSHLFNFGAVNLLTSGQTSDNLPGSDGYPTNGQSYQFAIFDNNGNATELYTITIDDCERYPSQIVYFRNALGGVDSYTFKMKNRKRLEAERSTFNRNSDVFGTTSFDKIWQTQYTERLELNSDWLTDAEFRWLSEMFLTSELWVLQNGSLVEAVVNSNSYNVSTRAVDRLQQLNIAIDIAFKNTTL
jgi:hypothetical protein